MTVKIQYILVNKKEINSRSVTNETTTGPECGGMGSQDYK